MDCVFTSANVRTFSRALMSLTQIGDEIQFHSLSDGLSLTAVNPSHSAYGRFFVRNDFFDEHQLTSNTSSEFHCTVSSSCCAGIFRSINFVDKSVEKCKIHVEETIVRFELFCALGVHKIHSLFAKESEGLQAVYAKSTCKNHIVMDSRFLSELITNFQNPLNEICLHFSSTDLIFENCLNPVSARTHCKYSCHEFDTFSVSVTGAVTFCLKEIHPLLFFIESKTYPISIRTNAVGGQPVVFSIETEPEWYLDIVVATLEDEGLSENIGENDLSSFQINKGHNENSVIESNRVEKLLSLNNKTSIFENKFKNDVVLVPDSDTDE